MIDFNNYQIRIVDFVKKTVSEFEYEIGKSKLIGIYCEPSKGVLTINFNIHKQINEVDLNDNHFEYQNYGVLHFPEWQIEYKKKKSEWRFFEEAGTIKISGYEKKELINKFYSTVLWYIVRGITKEINLPTTLIQYEIDKYNRIILHSEVETFGRVVVQYFRDEIYRPFVDEKERIIEMGYNNYMNKLNPHIADDLKSLMAERAELFCNLTKEQNQVLDKLILNIIDSTSFNVLRALDENNEEKSGIVLKINDINVTKLPLIGNGNLSGEYFDWVERFSKYGNFQC
jgi:hypothetical protein